MQDPAAPANTGVQLSRWEAIAKLSHPHLLRLFENGSCQLDKSVFLYVVMEYAEDNLAQILPHRALTPEEVRDLLEPALDALTFIHGKSLIHGRLKPSNVMAAQDQLKLSSDSLFSTRRSGGPIAHPARYDAPEVASGNILPASDSWSPGHDVDGSPHPARTCRGRHDRTAAGDRACAVHGDRTLLPAS